MDMVQQMASTHGHIGDSREMVEHIIDEHDKFTETAKVRGCMRVCVCVRVCLSE